MVAREIIVVKKPRSDVITDKPISFPPLQNLHLNLMENKKKLKKGLPVVQITQPQTAKKESELPRYTPETIAGVAGAAAGILVGGSKKSQKETFKVTEKAKTPKVTKPQPVPDDEGAGADPEENEFAELVFEGEDAEGEGDVGEEDAGEAEDGLEKDLGENADGEDAGDENGTAEGAAKPEPDASATASDDPYAGLSPEERESKEKEEYIWRFRILKKQYKNRNIPEYNEHDDLGMMKMTYERAVREIHLEDSVESYRTYLIGGFMVMEFVSNNWIGVDLTGFTSQQMLMMNKYDRLLIELGEKSYNRWGANLPVELRLIGFILLQAGLFYLGKIIADKAGSSVAELFRGITGQPPAAAVADAEKKSTDAEINDVPPKKKMRGPSVKVEDLKKKVEKED